MNIRTGRTALYGLLIALAFIFGYIETLIPVYLGAPGVKLGLKRQSEKTEQHLS